MYTTCSLLFKRMIKGLKVLHVFPSFTGKTSSECLGSLFCNTFKQLYLKHERINIIPSVQNENCFIYLRRKAQNKLCLGFEH